MLQRAFSGPPPDRTWRRIVRGDLSWETLRARSGILAAVRAHFRERGFWEVDTPIAQSFPNIDPHVYPVAVADAAGRVDPFYLHTSPELAMKKLLAAGSGDIFYLGKVFRDREGSPLHAPEFTMLEWYRTGGRADDLMRDVEELARTLARSFGNGEEIARAGTSLSLSRPWRRWELSDAVRELLGVAVDDAEGMRGALAARGLRPGAGEAWEDLFFRAYVDVVEPALRSLGTCFLTGFPASLAAMARRRPDDPGTAERFEGYVAGIELVNGYEELTDPVEQEERMAALAARHRAEGGGELPVDPDFLDALRAGLPACAGAALGVDRLVMLLLGKEDIADVMFR